MFEEVDVQGGIYTGRPLVEVPFWAQIDDYDDELYYAWHEVYPKPDGTFEDAEAGRVGELDACPLWEANGNILTVGSYVLIRRAQYDADLDWVYITVYGATSASTTYPTLTVVTNVCPIFGGSGGTLSGIMVEYSDIDLSTGYKTNVRCVTDPDDCCSVSVSCCGDVLIPRTLYATFYGMHSPYEDGPTCPCLEGQSVALTYSDQSGAWEATIPAHGALCPALEEDLYLSLKCQTANSDLGGLLGWRFFIETDPAGVHTVLQHPSSVVCNPLCLVYHDVSINNYGGAPVSLYCDEAIASTVLITTSVPGSSGACGADVATDCCPNGLNATLYATITDASGCSCLAGTYQLTWNGRFWATSGSDTVNCSGTKTLALTLYCNPNTGLWSLGWACGTGVSDPGLSFSPLSGSVADSADCDLPEMIFSGLAGPTDCCNGGTFDVTITD